MHNLYCVTFRGKNNNEQTNNIKMVPLHFLQASNNESKILMKILYYHYEYTTPQPQQPQNRNNVATATNLANVNNITITISGGKSMKPSVNSNFVFKRFSSSSSSPCEDNAS